MKNEGEETNKTKTSPYRFEDFEIVENEQRYRYFKDGKVQKSDD